MNTHRQFPGTSFSQNQKPTPNDGGREALGYRGGVPGLPQWGGLSGGDWRKRYEILFRFGLYPGTPWASFRAFFSLGSRHPREAGGRLGGASSDF